MTGPNERLESRRDQQQQQQQGRTVLAIYCYPGLGCCCLQTEKERGLDKSYLFLQQASVAAATPRTAGGAGTEAVASALEAAAVTTQSGPGPPKMQRNLWVKMKGHVENQQNWILNILFIFLYELLYRARGLLESKSRKKQTKKKLIYNVSDKNYEYIVKNTYCLFVNFTSSLSTLFKAQSRTQMVMKQK